VTKILVPVDGSENALRAAAFAAGMAAQCAGVQVTLLHVIVPVEKYLKFFTDVPMPPMEDDLQKYAADTLAEAAAPFVNAGLRVDKQIADGDPGPTIARYAGDNGFDQIVMGTRGLGDLKGLILGSVSHQVMHLAKCAVTLVK